MTEDIRPETLQTLYDWVQPTPAEVQTLLKKVLENFHAARTPMTLLAWLGLPAQNGDQMLHKWKTGAANIPYPAWCLLAHRRIRKIWRRKK